MGLATGLDEVDVFLLGVRNLDDRELDGLELEDKLREAIRLTSQSGNFGAALGRGGITLEFPETVVLEGKFTLGKLGEEGEIPGKLLLCSKVRSKR